MFNNLFNKKKIFEIFKKKQPKTKGLKIKFNLVSFCTLV